MTEQQMIQKGSGLQVVVGLGQSGLSVANYLTEQGYPVAVTDGNAEPRLASELPESVQIRAFGHIDADLLCRASRIIVSPGISLETPALQQAKQAGIAIVSDIQLFCDACDVPIIAITGSNAKSTVTTLVGQMVADAGIQVGVGGNIGVPALTLLAGFEKADETDGLQVAASHRGDTDLPSQLAVLELSSFQLETVSNLKAKVATVLNMSPDHLDRHGDMLGYHRAKHRIFQGVESIVINRDDALSRPLIADEVKCLSVGSNAPDLNQYGLIRDADGQVYLARGANRLLSADELKIKGQHNLINALSALALGELAGLPLESMLQTLRQFAGLPHRCQFVACVDGVDYFNDSKGTNIGSTQAAIMGLGEVYSNQQGKLLLILGGQGKGQQFGELAPLINTYVSHVLFIGEDATVIEQHLCEASLADSVQRQHCETLAEAVRQAKAISEQPSSPVKAVLLSPACASFDQFSGFVQRGEQFVELVHTLTT
ncbi:UDP-N-acetylmuramoyl-L-alanine--D-glutamate ligase [Psychrobacter sp. I-STPA6b]|uniref:UDP-N-acetylmuramoyl-L-alanine--D-glutamate ligase n=1 Tax=Psychrobacter sp. I-STPA6b TaxID=2585718 RepID=UPI001D0CDCD0|nr:UDP-N-acetylmuramoyl-L-alanine--D-glutamate ligase [Psychrobacter sp. I-STPA6b]